MSITLYAHPFSSYCWKVQIALWENALDFRYAQLGDPAVDAEWEALWPLRKMPTLVDDGKIVQEATVIIEHLQLCHGGPMPLIPADPIAALEVRRLDRLSDNYLMAPMQEIVGDYARPEADRDMLGVGQARDLLGKALDWWDAHIAAQDAAGKAFAWDDFSLIDCATFPALFYIDWIVPFEASHPALHAYRARLMKRPSVARAVEDARPFRPYFPPGAPDRD